MSDRVRVRSYRQRRESQIRVPHISDDILRAAERALFMESALEHARKVMADERQTVAFAGVSDDQTHGGRPFIVGLVRQDIPGYSPTVLLAADGKTPIAWSRFSTYDEATEFANRLNEELGLSPTDAMKIVLSSMRLKRRHRTGDRVKDNPRYTSYRAAIHISPDTESLKAVEEQMLGDSALTTKERHLLAAAIDSRVARILEGAAGGTSPVRWYGGNRLD